MGLSYIIVALGIFIAKFIGLFRDVIFASAFGTTSLTDIYFQVFGVVTLVFTGIGIALQTMLIKNLNKDSRHDFNEQKEYTGKFIVKVSAVLIAVIAVLYVLARPLTHILLPGIGGPDFEIAVKLTKVMLPSLWAVVVAYIISGALQNRRVFFISSVMSLPYNAIIVLSLVFKCRSIITIGIVTTIGWFLHVAVQLPWFYKQGYRLFVFDGILKNRKDSLSENSELVWIFISNMMFQLCFLIDKAFVSSKEGMVTSVNYASNLFIQISSVFVVAMSSVVFPSLAKNYEEKQIDRVRDNLRHMITMMSVIFIAFLLTVTLFGENIIRLIYQRGSFTAQSTEITAHIFIIYSFGIFGYVAQELFNKVMYLGGKYKYTVTATLCVIAVKLLTDITFSSKVNVIAVSTTVLLCFYAIIIAFAITRVVGNYINRELLKNIGGILISALGAFAVYLGFAFFAPGLISHKILFVIPIICCGIMYLFLLFIFKIHKVIFKKEKKF